jgi:hypothetical protein
MLLVQAALQEIGRYLALPFCVGGAVALINISKGTFIGGVHVTVPSRVAGNTSVSDRALFGERNDCVHK